MEREMKRFVLGSLLAVGLAAWLPVRAGEIQDAAGAGDLARVRALLQAKPELVNQRDLGTTPLHEAARNGHLEVVKLLVASGAAVNVSDSSKCTPLKLALGYQRKEVAAWLRQNGGLESVPATTPSKTNLEPGPIMAPAPPVAPAPAAPVTPARPTPTREIPSTAPVAPPWTPPPTQPQAPPEPRPVPITNNGAAFSPVTVPIHDAAEAGDIAQVKALLKAWPELLEAENQKGLTPLHAASANGKTEVMEALLARRANVNARTRLGWTPLHFAAVKGDAPAVALLLSYGAAVSVKTRSDETPLHFAARAGSVEAARMLLERKAEPNVAEKTAQSTPLHLAVVQGNPRLVELLVAAGADLNPVDEHGDTPLSLAKASGRPAIISLLEQRGAREAQLKAVTPIEQSLLDYYRKVDQVLRTGSVAEKRKLALSMVPTPAEAQRLFPKHAAVAGKVADELRQEIKAASDKGFKTPAEEGTIWRLQTAPSSPYVQYCQSKGLMAADIPIYTLVVKRVGRKSLAEMYCFVNDHWVLLPPPGRVLPQ
jgi:ankyrin repeat protein